MERRARKKKQKHEVVPDFKHLWIPECFNEHNVKAHIPSAKFIFPIDWLTGRVDSWFQTMCEWVADFVLYNVFNNTHTDIL